MTAGVMIVKADMEDITIIMTSLIQVYWDACITFVPIAHYI